MKDIDKRTAKANYDLCRIALNKVGTSSEMRDLEGQDEFAYESEEERRCSNVKFFIVKCVVAASNLAAARLAKARGGEHYNIEADYDCLTTSIEKAKDYVGTVHAELKCSAMSLLKICEAAAIIAAGNSIKTNEYKESARAIEGDKRRGNWEK